MLELAEVARTKASSLLVWPSGWQEHQVSPIRDIADILNEDLPGFPEANKNGVLKYIMVGSSPDILLPLYHLLQQLNCHYAILIAGTLP
jgi:hypothetical protein